MTIILSAYPIAMIIIGATNKDKCKIEPMIPIWLIVSGSVMIFTTVLVSITAIIEIIL